MRVASFVLYLGLAGAVATAGTITLSTDIELPATNPDPNQIITVFIHSDAPILFMDLLIRVNGDAAIAGVMNETTCAPYGWDANSIVTCTVNPDNSIELFGLNWNENEASTVGYLQFRCNSGFVAVYLDAEQTTACGWSEDFTCSTEPISVGTLTPLPLIERNEPEFSVSLNPLEIMDPCWLDLQSILEMSQLDLMSCRGYLKYGESLPWVIVDSDITTNQVWEPNNIYYVTHQIQVQSLLVIEPGTVVLFGYQCYMVVNDGGTLISQGTPDKPIVYTSHLAVDYEVEEDTYIGIGNWWYWYGVMRFQYLCPMIVESTASPATRINYSFVEGAQAGLILDGITLDNPIENNTFFGNMRGVYEVGPALTDVRNNLFFYHEYSAIEMVTTTEPNDVPERILRIEHNTCDYGLDYGILIHGTADPNGPMPYVVLAHNVMTENYTCGLYLNGCMHYMSVSNGYCINEYDKNYDFTEYNPVHSAVYPYDVMGEDSRLWHRFVPDCNFIDAGMVSISQTPFVGMSTDLEGFPDSGMLDLGYHYMDWNFIRTSGIDDVMAIADYWLCYDPADPNSPNHVDPNTVPDPNDLADLLRYSGDLDGSGLVDLQDLAVLSRQWRSAPAVPDLVPVLGGNPDEGWITITASEPDDDTAFVYVYVNGRYVGQVHAMGSAIPKFYDLSESGNGPHEIKFIAMDSDGNLTHSQPFVYEPNEPLPLKYCIVPSTYEPNEPVPFAFCNPEGGDVTVSVYGNGGELAWSQVITGEPNNAQVPANILSQLLTVDSIEFTAAGWQPPVIKPFPVKRFDGNVDPEVKALIICPDAELNHYDPRVRWQVLKSFIDQGVKVLPLDGSQATWENVAKYGQYGFVKYIYFMGHGDYQLELDEGTFYRTCNKLYDTLVLSCKHSEFPEGQGPSWCKPLPEYVEKYAPTWASMNFDRLRFFYAHSCYSGRLKIDRTGTLVERQSGRQGLVYDAGGHSDISLALRLDDDYESRYYHGYWNKGVLDLIFQTSYQKWTKNIWSKLGDWQDLNDAVLYAIDQAVQDGNINDPNSVLSNYRLFGQGDITTIRLRSR